MIRAKTSALLLLAACLAPAARGDGADFASPLVPSAGTGTETVLIADAPSLPFSLFDIRAVVRTLLSRIATTVRDLEPGEVTPERLAGASYVVLLGTQEWPDADRLAGLARAAGKPVFAIGTASAAAGKPVNLPSALVQRGDARFRTPLTAFPPARLPQGAETLATLTSAGSPQPLAWRSGPDITFAALPVEPVTGFVFSDLLLNFYGVDEAPASGVLLVVEGFARGGDPTPLRRLAEEFSAKGWPFILSIEAPENEADPVTDNTFFSTLRFVQGRGGRVFLSLPGNFWNRALDQPAGPDAITGAVSSLTRSLPFLVKGGVFPFGLRLPDSGFGREAVGAASGLAKVALGTLPASDVTASLVASPGTPVVMAGLTVLPTSTWLDPSATDGQSWETARNLMKLRGMVLTVRIPAWWPLADAGAIIKALETMRSPVLDVLETPVVITTTKFSILGKNARPIPWPGSGELRLRLFDAQMNLLSDTPKTAKPGEMLRCPDTAAFLVAEPQTP